MKKSFDAVVSEVRNELWARDIPIVNCPVVISKRLRKAFGNTKLKIRGSEKEYKIQIADFLVREGSEEYVKNVIAHEYLHTCPDCMNHGEIWKAWAQKVSDAFSVTVYGNYNDAGFSKAALQEIKEKREKPKYVVFCADCGHEWQYKRYSKVLQNINNCKCPYCKTKSLLAKKLY